jgi:UDP-N-acetylmuramoyl-L-alanyl-D-glutamate--2,6-diaminopimelate ligase
MTLRELVTHIGDGVAGGGLDTAIEALVCDSRAAAPGAAFFALRGSRADGGEFIPQAVRAGAAAIVSEQAPPEGVTVPWVHVKNARVALARAAAAHYGFPARAMKLAGVTGTNGKTTTAFILHHLLNAGQLRAGLIGTLFYDLGGERRDATHTTPESLHIQELLAAMAEAGCRACAMEVSSHALDQERVHGLEFEAAVFTNLSQDHLDYHGTMESYFAAKARLFQQVEAQGRGRMIINMDDLWGRKLIVRHEHTGRVVKIGHGVGADYRAGQIRGGATGTDFELEHKGRGLLVRLPLIGDFNIHNALGAIAAAHALGMNLREAVSLVKDTPQVPGRLERVSDQGRFHVYVDYAHTPDALVNVLATLRHLKPSRIITVFGCGGDRDRSKRPKMAAAAGAGSDICLLTSDNPRTEDPEAILKDAAAGFGRGARHATIVDRREAIEAAIRGARDGDIILIAGKGHETYQEIHGVRHPFDDRAVARNLMLEARVAVNAEREERVRQREAERAMRGDFDPENQRRPFSDRN